MRDIRAPFAQQSGFTMRAVLLTNGHPHGFAIAAGLAAKGVRLDAVVYEARVSWADCRWTRLRSRSIKNGLAGAIARWFMRRRKRAGVLARYRQLSCPVVTIGNIYDDSSIAAMAALSPDLIVLGGIGIVSEDLIRIAKIGVVNGHPGLLPWLRGVGVVARAVERNIPVGATCHFVDRGIDTGTILQRRLVPVDETMSSVQALEDAANDLAVRMVIDVTAGIGEATVPDTAADQPAAGFPLCRWPTAEEHEHIAALIRDGSATRAFRRARDGGITGPDFVLPANWSLDTP